MADQQHSSKDRLAKHVADVASGKRSVNSVRAEEQRVAAMPQNKARPKPER